jgi:PPK2 family polyphosphate:nucleotide phosphotransferase
VASVAAVSPTHLAAYGVRPGAGLSLSDRSPQDSRAFAGTQVEAKELLERLSRRLEELQELLWANRRHKLLLILQGMDTSGKDGTIRHVFRGVDPLGVRVASFKAPTADELARDFLWRVHREVPAAGEIGIFNRSHYEDVLVVRVRKLQPPSVWKARYAQINEFESLLASTGTVIRKCFLHLSREEQRQRLQARLDDPAKRWKFRCGDLEERALWDEYQRAYEEALERTSTAAAPWYVVPADRKWYRNLVVASLLIQALEGLEMTPPPADPDLDGVVVE